MLHIALDLGISSPGKRANKSLYQVDVLHIFVKFCECTGKKVISNFVENLIVFSFVGKFFLVTEMVKSNEFRRTHCVKVFVL